MGSRINRSISVKGLWVYLLISHSTSWAPSFANLCAIIRPNPWPAPVIRMILPVTSLRGGGTMRWKKTSNQPRKICPRRTHASHNNDIFVVACNLHTHSDPLQRITNGIMWLCTHAVMSVKYCTLSSAQKFVHVTIFMIIMITVYGSCECNKCMPLTRPIQIPGRLVASENIVNTNWQGYKSLYS